MRSTRLLPFVLGLLAVAPVVASGCLDRPVVPIVPSNLKVSVQPLSVKRPDKVDLLFVIDNSASMKDKQSELGRRIPELVSAITSPSVDPTTGKVTRVLDVHVGVITSSLGASGTGACQGPHADDRAHLLPRAGDPPATSGYELDPSGNPTAAACPSGLAAGQPLSWVADRARDASATFAGEAGARQLQAAASCVVDSVKEFGCGYEATWEAAYRFLADPAPSASENANCSKVGDSYSCSGVIKRAGLDAALLEQRARFLRPDSLLAVVVLSDENDFSLRPEGANWKPWGIPTGGLRPGWAGCANVPDDLEPDDALGAADLFSRYKCKSCEADPSDPACAQRWPLANGDLDTNALRGFHQVQRFGFNVLWGRQRYVDAFSKRQILGGDGKLGRNGIFAGGRDEDMIVVAGIVGVPQTLVADAGVPKVLSEADWERIASPDLGKRDPHMIESFKKRPGIREFGGDRGVDPINGGDRVISADDLQYACISKRTTPSGGDDCDDPAGNPLCDGRNNQPYFKAYPGLRHLRILHDLGARGFVGSICAESYSPAIRGIGERIKSVVDAQCIRTDVTPDPVTGEASCFILETFADASFDGKARCEDVGKGYCTPGAAPCRAEGTDYPPLAPEMAAAQLTLPLTVTGSDGFPKKQSTRASVDGGNVYVEGPDGKRHLVCEMMQLAGGRAPEADAKSCRQDPKFTTPSTGGGWCYSDDATVLGDACRAKGAAGKIRFLGDVEPKNGSQVFTVCIGR